MQLVRRRFISHNWFSNALVDHMKIILGSASEWRQNLLRQIVADFEVITPDIDEKAIRRDDPGELVQALAEAKSRAVQAKYAVVADRSATGTNGQPPASSEQATIKEPAIIITSDQVVVFNGEIREKPESEAQARQWIAEAHVHPSETWTAVHVVNTATGQVASGLDVARHWFKPIPREVADLIIAKGYWSRSGGGFNVEDPLVIEYAEKSEGPQDSIMGLPLELTKKLIDEVSK